MRLTLTRADHPLSGARTVRMLRRMDVDELVVERGVGDPNEIDKLRRAARKPDLPVRFEADESCMEWATEVARAAARKGHMTVFCDGREVRW